MKPSMHLRRGVTCRAWSRQAARRTPLTSATRIRAADRVRGGMLSVRNAWEFCDEAQSGVFADGAGVAWRTGWRGPGGPRACASGRLRRRKPAHAGGGALRAQGTSPLPGAARRAVCTKRLRAVCTKRLLRARRQQIAIRQRALARSDAARKSPWQPGLARLPPAPNRCRTRRRRPQAAGTQPGARTGVQRGAPERYGRIAARARFGTVCQGGLLPSNYMFLSAWALRRAIFASIFPSRSGAWPALRD